MTKNTHGGKRKNAGRPTKPPTIPYKVTIDKKLVLAVREKYSTKELNEKIRELFESLNIEKKEKDFANRNNFKKILKQTDGSIWYLNSEELREWEKDGSIKTGDVLYKVVTDTIYLLD